MELCWASTGGVRVVLPGVQDAGLASAELEASSRGVAERCLQKYCEMIFELMFAW